MPTREQLQTAPDPSGDVVTKLRELLEPERVDALLDAADNFTGCRKPLRHGLTKLLEETT